MPSKTTKIRVIEKKFKLWVDSDELHGEVFLPANEQKIRGGLILCHGIPSGEGRQSKGYDYIGRLFARRQLATVFFNFRGTGESGGNIDLVNWKEDLQELINYYFTGYGYTPLIFVGFSAGAAVALEVAAEDDRVKALALGACPGNFSFLMEKFTPETVWEWFRQLGLFRRPDALSPQEEWLQRFMSIRPEEKIHLLLPRPILIIHGEKDDLVPLSDAYSLYERAGGDKRVVTFPRVGHRLRSSRKALKYLQIWIEEFLTTKL